VALPKFKIRSFDSADQAVCFGLYLEGVVGGQAAANDSGLDMDDIQMAYLKPKGNHFWVAESEGQIVGMIGVMGGEGTGEIRRLRVTKAFRRRGIGSALLEEAVTFCREQNYLKIALDTFVEREPAMRLFEKFKFRHGKTRVYADKELMYFYLDLYSGEAKDGNG
jgi:ribosomal protein S18 acetylase RimI-like enzyme